MATTTPALASAEYKKEIRDISKLTAGIVAGFNSLDVGEKVVLHPDVGTWTVTVGSATTMVANSRAVPLNKQLQNPMGSVSLSGFSLDPTVDNILTLIGNNVTGSKDGLTKLGITRRVSFIHTGQKLELVFSASTQSDFFIKVDGKYESLTAIVQPTATIYRAYDFGSVGTRRIDIIEQGVNGRFSPTVVWVEPNDTIFKAPVLGPLCIIEGDSFCSQAESWPFAFAEQMQWGNVWGSGVSGSGYVNDQSGTLQTYGERLQTDVIDPNPDVVIFSGSNNDNGFAYQIIYDAALSVYTRTAAALPNAIIVAVIHTFNGSDEITSNGYRNAAALKQAAADAGIIFINAGNPEVTGNELQTTVYADIPVGATKLAIDISWIGALNQGITGSSVHFGNDAAGTGEYYYIKSVDNANKSGLIIDGPGGTGCRTAYPAGTPCTITTPSFIVGRDGNAAYGNADALMISGHPTVPLGRNLLGRVIAQAFVEAIIKAAK